MSELFMRKSRLVLVEPGIPKKERVKAAWITLGGLLCALLIAFLTIPFGRCFENPMVPLSIGGGCFVLMIAPAVISIGRRHAAWLTFLIVPVNTFGTLCCTSAFTCRFVGPTVDPLLPVYALAPAAFLTVVTILFLLLQRDVREDRPMQVLCIVNAVLGLGCIVLFIVSQRSDVPLVSPSSAFCWFALTILFFYMIAGFYVMQGTGESYAYMILASFGYLLIIGVFVAIVLGLSGGDCDCDCSGADCECCDGGGKGSGKKKK